MYVTSASAQVSEQSELTLSTNMYADVKKACLLKPIFKTHTHIAKLTTTTLNTQTIMVLLSHNANNIPEKLRLSNA